MKKFQSLFPLVVFIGFVIIAYIGYRGADVKTKKTEGLAITMAELASLNESISSTLSELIDLADSLGAEIKKKTGFTDTSLSSETEKFLAKEGVKGKGSWALAHAYVLEGNYKKGIEEYHRYLKRDFINPGAYAPAHAGLGDAYYELAILDMINRNLYQQKPNGLFIFTPDERVREVFKVAKREFDIATSLSRFIAEEKYHRVKQLDLYLAGTPSEVALTVDQLAAVNWLLALSLKRGQLEEAPAHRYLSGHPYPLLKAARTRHLKEIDRLESNLSVQLKSMYELTSSLAEWNHLWVFYQVLVESEGEMGIKPEEKKKLQHCGQTILTHAGVLDLKLPFEVQQHLRLENNKPEHSDQLIQSLESQLESQYSVLYHQLYGLVFTEFYMVPYLTHSEFFPESMIDYEVRRSLFKLAKIAQEVGVFPKVKDKLTELLKQSSFDKDMASEVVKISEQIFYGILTNFRKTD